ncbi:polyprenyl synthetase family protein [Ancylobacter dichloromethanicus]|uniref:Probable farnesyl diphosphate synthase n=1 Tax=Ancylobacter dichloromethanicus TaxID=518825 RepID=A0A9W6J5M6_9HYPH|nr:farnesyl diphosphate synthase [Ancylobacter dichloromethanicus]MBS7555589.1 polyprenyl synthetase family protein [Ancylobacter dichloromethanicus]GLK70792.1 geranylgeranyl pyrophosphate synthase [Ancylobacter dichloromethanicus]
MPASENLPPPLAAALARTAEAVTAHIDGAIAESGAPGERLAAAMRHATLAGGKRLRPFLVLETAALFGVRADAAMPAAAALECIHCYSLVHDDLPAMDDDELRRGQPTVHRAFDEATAILAGDGLLTLAFEILAREDTGPYGDVDARVRLALVASLARAAGVAGMIGGQMLDLAAEGRFGEGGLDPAPLDLPAEAIIELQAMKTGALLRQACEAGALLGGASPAERASLDRYARAVGRAFQIADDLLDVEGEAALVGKALGKDAAAGKATLVGRLGIDGARSELARLVGEAEAALSGFGTAATLLVEAAYFVAYRRN